MNKTLTLLSFLVLIAFLGGVVYGHVDQSVSRSDTDTTNTMTKALDRSHALSELTRAMVKDSQGQYVGRITDVVISINGRISFVVLSQLTMDGKLVALPFNALSFDEKGKSLVLDTTSDKLANAPIFNRSYLSARSWAEDSNRYFGIGPSWGEERKENLCDKAAAAAPQISMTEGWNRPYESTEIVGTQVRNPQGEELGKVDDLVFDTEGRISFVIVGYGGFLGISQNLVAVPVNFLSYAEQPRHFVLDATKEKIQSASPFSRRTLDDPEWAKGVYRYFGQQPNWTTEDKEK